MKRLLALALCLGIPSVAGAQVIENFDGGVFPPAGWTTTDNTSAGNLVWLPNSQTSSINLVGGVGESATFQADDYNGTFGAVIFDSYLTSPGYLVPAGHTLEFNLNFQDFAGAGDFDFDISTDGGATWTTLETWTNDTPVGGSGGAFIVPTYDMAAYAGMTVNFRFRYWAYTGTSFWWSQIDDLNLLPTPITPEGCGLGFSVPTLFEDFDGGVWPPSGWSVVDVTSNGAWNTNSFYAETNDTNGSGVCACIDSDYIGSSTDVDTSLITPSLVIPVAGTQGVGFEMAYDYFSGDYSDVDISTDGGITWTNLARYNVDEIAYKIFDLSAYAGTTANLRFRYVANYDWEWMIDDFSFGPYLPIPAASATTRNDVGNVNPNVYTVTGLPMPGRSFTCDIDLSTTGHGFAQLFGYAGPFSFAVTTGQVVLIDLTHPGGEALALPVMPAPVSYTLNVPNVCSFAGFQLSTQAAGFNIPNNTPWILTNAVDLVVGW